MPVVVKNFFLYNTDIRLEMNALVDDIDDYLESLTPTYKGIVQYQKLSLDMFIKIDTEQEYQTDASLGNYAMLQQDNKNYYFYVMGVEWKSSKTLMLQLSMDTINTFINDIVFTNQTTITRQHKNRFVMNTHFVDNVATNLHKKIDRKSEGISGTKYKTGSTPIYANESKLNQLWYLLYRNASEDETETVSPLNLYLIPSVSTVYATGSNLGNIDELDRSNSKLVMIICLPYVPKEITWTGNTINLPTGWTIEDLNFGNDDESPVNKKAIKIGGLNEDFTFNLPNRTISDFDITVPADTVEHIKKMSKSIDYESKLLHSDYHLEKYAYDTIASNIRLEDITTSTEGVSPIVTLQYKQSNGLVSNLGFKWGLSNGSYKTTEDYENYIISNRNNEIGLLNSEYLNYLRTGYRIERNQTTLKDASAIVSSAGTGASALLAGIKAAKQNTLGMGKAALIIGVATAVVSVYSAISNIITNEQNLKQTKIEKIAQSVSVSNNNDVDILKFYNGNKLNLITYNISEELKNEMFNLFYYSGYVDNIRAVPTYNSRYWFNFIQCKPVFDRKTSETYDYYLDDISSRFQMGVTVFHHHNFGGLTDEYDWNQQYENWEQDLFN